MAADLHTLLRDIVRATVVGSAWEQSPDCDALIGLIAELDLTDPSQIHELLPSDEPWANDLAKSLADRSMPARDARRSNANAGSEATANVLLNNTIDDLVDAHRWRAAGFRRTETAVHWAASGMTPQEAGAWYDLDLRGPDEALRWAAEGFSPATASEWVDATDDPLLAAKCRHAGVSPHQLATGGIRFGELLTTMAERDVHWVELRPYLKRGVEPDLAVDWVEACRSDLSPALLAFAWATRGFSPVEADRWQSSGFGKPEDAFAWATRGFSPVEADRWQSSGFGKPEDAFAWSSVGFTAETATGWTAVGIHRATDAQSMTRAIGSPEGYAAWAESGVSDPGLISGLVGAGVGWSRARGLVRRGLGSPELASLVRHGSTVGLESFLDSGHGVEIFFRWSKAGVQPATAVKWLELGFERPADARTWTDQGFDPATAHPWRTLGIDPTTAARWGLDKFSPREADAWISAGIDRPAEARAWIDADISSPTVAGRWKELGCDRAGDASKWVDFGFSLIDAVPWLEVGLDAQTAASIASFRLSPTSPRRFAQKTGRPPEDLLEWLERDIKLTEALEWCSVGIASPLVAHRRRATSDPAAWQRLAALGITHDEIAQIASSRTTDQDIALFMSRARSTNIDRLRTTATPARDWPGWVRVCSSVTIACEWIDGDVDLHDLEATVEAHGLDPRDLRSWTSAGFGPRDVLDAYDAGFPRPGAWRRHLAPKPSPSGSGSAPSNAVVRPPQTAPPPVVDPFDEWLVEGRQWLEAVGADTDRYHDLLQAIHDEGARWAEPDEDVLGVAASEEWLDEVYERLVYVSELLHKEPRWPQVFESDEITIVLDGSGDYPLAWVGAGSSGGLVCFHPERYEIYTAAANDSWRYMAGAAISWFIDCCIVIQLERHRSPFEMSHPSSAGTDRRRVSPRYIPRATFVRQYQTVRRGGGTSPRAHLVDGFVRTFHLGQQPTEDARRRAPARIRRRLKPDQTWVSPHVRGGTYAQELKTYLSKYSALADAMAFADQDLER